MYLNRGTFQKNSHPLTRAKHVHDHCPLPKKSSEGQNHFSCSFLPPEQHRMFLHTSMKNQFQCQKEASQGCDGENPSSLSLALPCRTGWLCQKAEVPAWTGTGCRTPEAGGSGRCQQSCCRFAMGCAQSIFPRAFLLAQNSPRCPNPLQRANRGTGKAAPQGSASALGGRGEDAQL